MVNRGFGALLKCTSVVVLREEKGLYIHSPHLQFLPDRDSNSQPFDYESHSLTIRSRLPPPKNNNNDFIQQFVSSASPYSVILESNTYVNNTFNAYLWTCCLHSNQSINNLNSVSTYGSADTEQHSLFTYVV